MKRLIFLAGLLTLVAVQPSRLSAQVQIISPQPWDTVFTPVIHFSWHPIPGATNYEARAAKDWTIYYGSDTEVDRTSGQQEDGKIDWWIEALDANGNLLLPRTPLQAFIYYPDGYPVALVSPASGTSDLSEPVIFQWNITPYTPPIYNDVLTSKLYLALDSATLISYEFENGNEDDGAIYGTSIDSVHLLPSTTYYWAIESYNFRWFTPMWKFTTSPSDPPGIWAPQNGDTDVPTPVQFGWYIEIPQNAKAVVALDSLLTQNVQVIDSSGERIWLGTDTKYFWHVTNTNTGETSGVLSFTTSKHIDTGYLHPADVKLQSENKSQFRLTYNSGIPTLVFQSAEPRTIRIDAIDVLGRIQYLVEQPISAPSGTIAIPHSDLKVLFYLVTENGNHYILRALSNE